MMVIMIMRVMVIMIKMMMVIMIMRVMVIMIMRVMVIMIMRVMVIMIMRGMAMMVMMIMMIITSFVHTTHLCWYSFLSFFSHLLEVVSHDAVLVYPLSVFIVHVLNHFFSEDKSGGHLFTPCWVYRRHAEFFQIKPVL